MHLVVTDTDLIGVGVFHGGVEPAPVDGTGCEGRDNNNAEADMYRRSFQGVPQGHNCFHFSLLARMCGRGVSCRYPEVPVRKPAASTQQTRNRLRRLLREMASK